MKNQLRKLFSLPEELIIEKVKNEGKKIGVFCRIRKRKINCLYCKGKVSGYDHIKVNLRHTAIDGKIIYLNLTKKRFQCKKCKHVFTDNLKGFNRSSSTDHFIQLVQEKARNSDFSSVAREIGIGCSTVIRMVDLLDTDKVRIPKKRSCA